jgi:hypothetical protein
MKSYFIEGAKKLEIMTTSEARKNLYYNESNNDERVKIVYVHSNGNCVVRNKQGVYSTVKIGNLKKVQ